jgi:hypothetical protein
MKNEKDFTSKKSEELSGQFIVNLRKNFSLLLLLGGSVFITIFGQNLRALMEFLTNYY